MSSEVGYVAERIADEASRVGAERVVLRTADEYIFASLELSSILEALRHDGLIKYKLQGRQEGRWVDVQRYRRIEANFHTRKDPVEITNSIGVGNFEALKEIPQSDILGAVRAERDSYTLALRKLHRSTFLELAQRGESSLVSRAAAFLEGLIGLDPFPAALYLGTNFKLQSSIESEQLASIHKRETQQLLESRISIIAEGDLNEGSAPAKMAAASMLAKIRSLSDRKAAAAYFQRMLRNDANDLLDTFYLEEGTRTYFDSSDLMSEASLLATQIQDSIRPLEVTATNNTFGIVIAMDRSFFRIYGAQVLFYAQQLPDIDFNILLCGDAEEAESLVEDGKNFEQGLTKLNSIGRAKNVHYYQIPVPSFVENRQTFYASARFFFTELLAENYRTLYLMDADLTTDVDPRPYFERVASLDFAVPRMNGMSALYPWRRFMAGNVVLGRRSLDSNLIKDLQEYLVHGLHLKKNWTLDQNALAYAIERNPDIYTELNSFARPFYQNKFRLTWEKRYRGEQS